MYNNIVTIETSKALRRAIDNYLLSCLALLHAIFYKIKRMVLLLPGIRTQKRKRSHFISLYTRHLPHVVGTHDVWSRVSHWHLRYSSSAPLTGVVASSSSIRHLHLLHLLLHHHHLLLVRHCLHLCNLVRLCHWVRIRCAG